MLSAETVRGLLNGGAAPGTIREAIGAIKSDRAALCAELDAIPRRRADAAIADDAVNVLAALNERENELYGLLEIDDVQIERLEGKLTELNGGQMTAALAIVSDGSPATLSPARSALAEHLTAVSQACAHFYRERAPADRLREKLRLAAEQLAAAESELVTIDRAQADAIRDQAKGGGEIELAKPPSRAKAEAAVESGQRTCDAIRTALAACESDANAASSALGALRVHTDMLVLAVAEEAHAEALFRFAVARDAYIAAETEILAIGMLFSEHAHKVSRGDLTAAGDRIAWFRAGERAAMAFNKQPAALSTRGAVTARIASWLNALARMAAGDATARG